jgi:hypothetical protein
MVGLDVLVDDDDDYDDDDDDLLRIALLWNRCVTFAGYDLKVLCCYHFVIVDLQTVFNTYCVGKVRSSP